MPAPKGVPLLRYYDCVTCGFTTHNEQLASDHIHTSVEHEVVSHSYRGERLKDNEQSIQD